MGVAAGTYNRLTYNLLSRVDLAWKIKFSVPFKVRAQMLESYMRLEADFEQLVNLSLEIEEKIFVARDDIRLERICLA